MSRPTIASLEATVASLKRKVADVEEYLQEVDPNDWCIDKEEIITQVAELLDIDVSQYADVLWTVSIRGKVKVGKNESLNDLELTVRNETVECRNMGVLGHEFDDMSIEVEDVCFD
jgi:hypothetical protein